MQEDINECEPRPCKNGATCTDGMNGFTCQCAAGWTGQLCDVTIDECLSQPCQNSANCTDLLNGFRCKYGRQLSFSRSQNTHTHTLCYYSGHYSHFADDACQIWMPLAKGLCYYSGHYSHFTDDACQIWMPLAKGRCLAAAVVEKLSWHAQLRRLWAPDKMLVIVQLTYFGREFETGCECFNLPLQVLITHSNSTPK